jgi:hypothetical protein
MAEPSHTTIASDTMPKRAVRANAKSAPNLDAELLALAETVAVAAKRWDDALDVFVATEDRFEDASLVRAEAFDSLERIASHLAKTRVSTIDGLLAKARALESAFPDDDGFADLIRQGLDSHGPVDAHTIALSLARDILALAGAARAS